MEFLGELPNTEFVYSGTVDALLGDLKAGGTAPLAASEMWFDYDSPDYAHFDAYEAAFVKIAEAVSQAVGETASRQLGFDKDSFEPVALLMEHEIFADAFFHWPAQKLLLFTAQEDKELPIDIAIMRLP